VWGCGGVVCWALLSERLVNTRGKKAGNFC
jgi:hypothetical protein